MELARVAGDTALRYFRTNLTIESKRDGTPVTVADRAGEDAAREWLRRHFPHDAILGEEFGEERQGAARRWVLDPVDGTKTFIRGVPLWGTLVAVHEGNRVLGGAIYCPAVGEMVVAASGAGSWWNGRRCAVSTQHDLGQALVLTTDERFVGHPGRAAAWRDLASRAGTARSWGDCFGYLLVATGRAELMTDPLLSPWDAAALFPVISEAGGACTDWHGEVAPFSGAGVIASNMSLAGEARSILGVGPALPPAPSHA